MPTANEKTQPVGFSRPGNHDKLGVRSHRDVGTTRMISILVCVDSLASAKMGTSHFKKSHDIKKGQHPQHVGVGLLAAHPEMTKLGVGCVINNGDPI